MVADKGKKPKLSDKAEEENPDQIDEKLVLSIEKLQEVQDELEKVLPLYPSLPICLIYLSPINNLAKKFVFLLCLDMRFEFNCFNPMHELHYKPLKDSSCWLQFTCFNCLGPQAYIDGHNQQHCAACYIVVTL